jgi:starch synthase
MEIIHISAECYPAAKAGGLADVVGALPKYQNQMGQNASVIMPFYHNAFRSEHSFENIFTGYARMADITFTFHVLGLTDLSLGYDLYMIDIPGLFDRPNIYSYNDDTERFVTFQIATINWLCSWEKPIDIIHCHDQHTGFIPFMLSRIWEYRKFEDTPTVFTIHNGEYQGQFGFEKKQVLPPYHSFFNGLLEWHGLINPLASAIKCAWRVNTVSSGYLEEISLSMSGLEGLLKTEKAKCQGILNGIDTAVWDPATDPMLDTHFGITTVDKGKRANKDQLCKSFGLDPEQPLFVFIGRLVKEKGADVLPEVILQALSTHPGEQNILVLGSGDLPLQEKLWQLEQDFKGNYCAYIGYNEKLSHQMYAGADFLLMPSRVEPCGLNQLYALRYGTIPIVRRTGGLSDTVIDMGDGGFGFCHNQCTSHDVLHAMDRAREFYKNKKLVTATRKRIMKIDHSWNKAATDYIDMYKSLTQE